MLGILRSGQHGSHCINLNPSCLENSSSNHVCSDPATSFHLDLLAAVSVNAAYMNNCRTLRSIQCPIAFLLQNAWATEIRRTLIREPISVCSKSQYMRPQPTERPSLCPAALAGTLGRFRQKMRRAVILTGLRGLQTSFPYSGEGCAPPTQPSRKSNAAAIVHMC